MGILETSKGKKEPTQEIEVACTPAAREKKKEKEKGVWVQDEGGGPDATSEDKMQKKKSLMSRGIDHISLCTLIRNDQILGDGRHGRLLVGCGRASRRCWLLGEALAAVGGCFGRGLRGERGILGGC